jgi:glutamine amidotransferase/cyclase
VPSLLCPRLSHSPLLTERTSGAGKAQHFLDVFEPLPLREGAAPSSVEAALAAGVFHREEVRIEDVKAALKQAGFPVRREEVLAGAGEAAKVPGVQA